MGRWEEFRQTEDLTTRIHNILLEYPPGIGPFKEFLQNADDAKAESFSLFFDNSSHNTQSLIDPRMAANQGPALYVYNSAVFSDADFTGITRVGNSGKFTDVTTIGKFGLGFNCAYHFTDIPSFISRDQLIFFDPHGKYLPDNILGLRSNFLSDISRDQYPGKILTSPSISFKNVKFLKIS
jgi:sacsin